MQDWLASRREWVASLSASPSARSLRVFYRHRAAMLGLFILAAILLLVFVGPLFVPFDPLDFDPSQRLQPPSGQHLLGTDEIGRDLLARVLLGGQLTLLISVLSTTLALLIGGALGLFAGFSGSWVDEVVMRISDMFLAIPSLLLALAIIAALGGGTANVIAALAISTAPEFVRLVRGSALGMREREYVQAALAIGQGTTTVIFKHVLPNIVSPAIVFFTVRLSQAVLLASSLGFLGLGPAPPTPEWGSLLAAARSHVGVSPHLILVPGIALLLLTVSFNLIGDGVRDALDPKALGR